MIKEVTYYDIICDRCGKSLINESETCYPDTKSAEMVAKNSEWLIIGGKHYCPTAMSWTRKRTNMYRRKEVRNEGRSVNLDRQL